MSRITTYQQKPVMIGYIIYNTVLTKRSILIYYKSHVNYFDSVYKYEFMSFEAQCYH